MNALDLSGQVAVLSGGTRGIGQAITLALLEAGARVHATYNGNAVAARALLDRCAAFEGRLELARCDVADYQAVESFWKDLDQRHPDGTQILINHAGIRRDALLATMKPEDWRAVLDTNLTGSFAMSRFAVQSMLRARYGRIVMITSPERCLG